MSTLKAVFPEWKEGDLFTLSDTAEWHMVTPVRGDIALVSLPTTDMDNAPDSDAAFLIMERSVTGDGGMTLAAKCIGAEDAGVGKTLSSWFNRRGGGLHLCSSSPCTHFDPALLHCVQVRFFTKEHFEASFYGAAQRRQVKKWLGDGEPSEPEEAGLEEEDPAGKASKVPGKVTDREKGKGVSAAAASGLRPGVLRKRPASGPRIAEAPKRASRPASKSRAAPQDPVPENRVGGTAGGLDQDLRIEEGQPLSESGTAELKKKLEELRLRLGGAHKPKKVRFEGVGEASVNEEVEQEDSSGLDFVQDVKGLSTGLTLKRPHRQSEATKGTSSKSISSQLALQAQQMAQGDPEGKKVSRSSEPSKANENKEVLALLNRVLGRRSSAGRSGEGGDPPERESKRSRSASKKKSKRKKDRGRKKKRKLVNGVLMSASSSEDSSDDSTDSDSNEFEAPLRKRSKASPGSVLRLLVKRAQTALDQSALVEMDPTSSSAITTGVKLVTYYQLHIRPHYGHARGQMRDIYLMAQTLDLLRSGQIARACDHLAGHLMAMHQSLVDQGWGQAKYLEVIEGEEMGATTASILLETRRHAKASMKAEAPEAWVPGRNRGWFGGDNRGKGWWPPSDKGKGKGKKGKWKDKDRSEKGKEGKGKNAWKESQDKGEQASK